MAGGVVINKWWCGAGAPVTCILCDEPADAHTVIRPDGYTQKPMYELDYYLLQMYFAGLIYF